MKLQGMSIVFALVIVPIILVLSYYIGLQVDTIKLQTSYDSKLLDSTYDAMSAFELNTANEDLSTVSDSLRTIIEASYNVFISNLLTNLGTSNANKSYVEPFIPAVLYTLYDGYYICAPTKVPTVLTDSDGNAVAVGDRGVSGTAGNYTYTEPVKDPTTNQFPDITDNEILDYSELDTNHELDYGQLLYLKEGSTNIYTADINEAKLETKNVLKTYMPYSARYVGSNFDLTIVYTLDNFITVEGNIGNVYYTKSGYLIPMDNRLQIKIENQPADYSNNVGDYNQNDIQDLIEKRLADFTVTINDGTNTEFRLARGISKDALNTKINVLNNSLEETQEYWYSIYYNSNDTAMDNARSKFTAEYFNNLKDNYGVNNLQDASGSWNNEISIIETRTKATTPGMNNTYNQNDEQEVAGALKNLISAIEAEINNAQYELDTISSVVYYSKAYIFSQWVNEYLCDASREGGCEILENNLVEVAGQKYSTIKGVESLEFDFDTGARVFNFSGTDPVSVTEIPTDCSFYQHKLNVIKMSVQYNLNLAMSTYNNNESYLFEYEMPVIQAGEWEQILTHISITSFMQGLECGLKTYNNYKIVSSTNNDILTLPEEIYYVKKEEFNNEASEYHRINCSKLIQIDKDNSYNAEYMAFSSKEVKYDKISNKNRDNMNYEYDHKNYACYDCINDGNYFNRDTDGDNIQDAQINIFDTTDTEYNNYKNLRKSYYMSVGKERNDTYKMNAVSNSQGYEILRCDTPGMGQSSAVGSSLGINKIKAIEISIGTIYSQNASIRSAIYTFDYSSDATNLSNDSYSVATNNSSNNSTQSLNIKVIPGKLNGTAKFNITNLNPQCENANDIINPANGENAIVQLTKAIKYIRIIYK